MFRAVLEGLVTEPRMSAQSAVQELRKLLVSSPSPSCSHEDSPDLSTSPTLLERRQLLLWCLLLHWREFRTEEHGSAAQLAQLLPAPAGPARPIVPSAPPPAAKTGQLGTLLWEWLMVRSASQDGPNWPTCSPWLLQHTQLLLPSFLFWTLVEGLGLHRELAATFRTLPTSSTCSLWPHLVRAAAELTLPTSNTTDKGLAGLAVLRGHLSRLPPAIISLQDLKKKVEDEEETSSGEAAGYVEGEAEQLARALATDRAALAQLSVPRRHKLRRYCTHVRTAAASSSRRAAPTTKKTALQPAAPPSASFLFSLLSCPASGVAWARLFDLQPCLPLHDDNDKPDITRCPACLHGQWAIAAGPHAPDRSAQDSDEKGILLAPAQLLRPGTECGPLLPWLLAHLLSAAAAVVDSAKRLLARSGRGARPGPAWAKEWLDCYYWAGCALGTAYATQRAQARQWVRALHRRAAQLWPRHRAPQSQSSYGQAAAPWMEDTLQAARVWALLRQPADQPASSQPQHAHTALEEHGQLQLCFPCCTCPTTADNSAVAELCCQLPRGLLWAFGPRVLAAPATQLRPAARALNSCLNRLTSPLGSATTALSADTAAEAEEAVAVLYALAPLVVLQELLATSTAHTAQHAVHAALLAGDKLGCLEQHALHLLQQLGHSTGRATPVQPPARDGRAIEQAGEDTDSGRIADLQTRPGVQLWACALRMTLLDSPATPAGSSQPQAASAVPLALPHKKLQNLLVFLELLFPACPAHIVPGQAVPDDSWQELWGGTRSAASKPSRHTPAQQAKEGRGGGVGSEWERWRAELHLAWTPLLLPEEPSDQPPAAADQASMPAASNSLQLRRAALAAALLHNVFLPLLVATGPAQPVEHTCFLMQATLTLLRAILSLPLASSLPTWAFSSSSFSERCYAVWLALASLGGLLRPLLQLLLAQLSPVGRAHFPPDLLGLSRRLLSLLSLPAAESQSEQSRALHTSLPTALHTLRQVQLHTGCTWPAELVAQITAAACLPELALVSSHGAEATKQQPTRHSDQQAARELLAWWEGPLPLLRPLQLALAQCEPAAASSVSAKTAPSPSLPSLEALDGDTARVQFATLCQAVRLCPWLCARQVPALLLPATGATAQPQRLHGVLLALGGHSDTKTSCGHQPSETSGNFVSCRHQPPEASGNFANVGAEEGSERLVELAAYSTCFLSLSTAPFSSPEPQQNVLCLRLASSSPGEARALLEVLCPALLGEVVRCASDRLRQRAGGPAVYDAEEQDRPDRPNNTAEDDKSHGQDSQTCLLQLEGVLAARLFAMLLSAETASPSSAPALTTTTTRRLASLLQSLVAHLQSKLLTLIPHRPANNPARRKKTKKINAVELKKEIVLMEVLAAWSPSWAETLRASQTFVGAGVRASHVEAARRERLLVQPVAILLTELLQRWAEALGSLRRSAGLDSTGCSPLLAETAPFLSRQRAQLLGALASRSAVQEAVPTSFHAEDFFAERDESGPTRSDPTPALQALEQAPSKSAFTATRHEGGLAELNFSLGTGAAENPPKHIK
eukprot:g42108.t1